jgi:hypothetical protein
MQLLKLLQDINHGLYFWLVVSRCCTVVMLLAGVVMV